MTAARQIDSLLSVGSYLSGFITAFLVHVYGGGSEVSTGKEPNTLLIQTYALMA